MPYAFEGKVALVTGAASGLGLATAEAFAKAGASVALADANGDAVTQQAERLAAEGYKTLAITCDVTDEAQVKAMVEKTVDAFGRLDAAFNCAGVQSPVAEVADADGEEFDRVTAINLRGVWSSMKYQLIQMRKQGSGAIVNCSSLGGLVGVAGRATYHAAKHGVLGLTKTAGLEYAARGIRVNAVCPGIFSTPMLDSMISGGEDEIIDAMLKDQPIGRLGRPEELANAVLWLCSDESSFVIGHGLVVDGGYTVR